jgi:ATP-dependent Lon protease
MLQIEHDDETLEFSDKLPIVPLRDLVLFPRMIVPLLVGRPRSVNALEEIMHGDKIMFVVTQREVETQDPSPDDLHRVGTVVRVLQLLRLPDGTMKVLVEGLSRAAVKRFMKNENYLMARVELRDDELDRTVETEALMRSVAGQFEEYVQLSRKIPQEVLVSVVNMEDVSRFADTVATHLGGKIEEKQRVLEASDVTTRLRILARALSAELEILRLERKIESQVREQLQKSQKEFYLHQQMKAIQEELGHEGDGAPEVAELQKAIEDAHMSEEAEKKALNELDRLKKMSPMSPEATVVRTYIEWMTSMPWETRTKDREDIAEVEQILEDDHYGLKKPKERVLEYLAVLQLTEKVKGPILCFVGPPGVGKTSLGRSVARALDREFVRVSLGGVRDEAEIRGHRRTYIGSMPGRIIQGLRKAGSRNPVFLLDEVDKMSSDFRGDPASALLEVLDPEQNCTFNDHYLDVDFDLSDVMFITTANVLHTIPPALEDRMETIRLPGYLRHEKMQIAKKFLVPKQLEANGLDKIGVKFVDSAVVRIIEDYTREAGVRNLEREIANICRKIAREHAAKKKVTKTVTGKSVRRFLGMPRFISQEVETDHRVGVATGLAWTSVGGEILTVEVLTMKGDGNLTLTGKLGEVMQESAKAAFSYSKAHARELGIDEDVLENIDIHIHVPEGAIPKDGPSAGIAMATALVSALTGKPTRPDVAMTGEITLGGKILPIGGLNEKAVAAHRARLTTLIIPKKNEKDVAELPKKVSRDLKIQMVDRLDEVFELAFDDWTAPTLKPEERMDKSRPESPLPPAAGPY